MTCQCSVFVLPLFTVVWPKAFIVLFPGADATFVYDGQQGRTPLHLACGNGKYKVVKLLITKASELQLNVNKFNKNLIKFNTIRLNSYKIV